MSTNYLTYLFILCISPAVLAGTSCDKTPPKPDSYWSASRKAIEVTQKLNHLNPDVALLARAGSDLSKYGLRYSHIAFVVKNYPGKRGKWTVVHLLNECGTAHSSIYAQGLMNFFMDNLYKMDYQITVPDTAMQAKLYEALQPRQIQKMHGNQYSLIAYPFSTKYQNSNQWVLEILAKASNTQLAYSRKSAQNYLLKTGYKPSLIKVDSLAKFGASFKSHIKFDDHPLTENRLNQFSTVSVVSVVNYLRQRGLLM